jgi:hypothetical protein
VSSAEFRHAGAPPIASGALSLLGGALVVGFLALTVLVGSWMRDDISKLRQDNNSLKDELQQAATKTSELKVRIDSLVKELDERSAVDLENLCSARNGIYDATNLSCTFRVGNDHKIIRFRSLTR